MRAARRAAASGAFPWDAAIGFGLGVLRLSSREFWALTPRELARAIAALRAPPAAALDRGAFTALMAAFPDCA